MYSTSDFGDEDAVHDQLPSIEEARLQAMRSLRIAEQLSSRRSSHRFGSSSRLDSSGVFSSRGVITEQRRNRQKKLAMIAIGIGAVCIIIGVIGLSVGFVKNKNASVGNFSGSDFSRVSDVRLWLLENGITEEIKLNDSSSPQAKAMEWIADGDGFKVNLPRNVNDFDFIQRYALAVFYFTLGGEQWTRKNDYHFLSALATCAWNDPTVATDGRRFSLGVTCNLSGQVAAIHIRKFAQTILASQWI